MLSIMSRFERIPEFYSGSIKILVAITTCHTRPEQAPLQRRLWTHRVKDADYKFFYGRGENREPLPDEIFFNCSDSYDGLTDKARIIYNWAWDHDYDYIYDCDDDTYVIPERLLESGFAEWDYIGRQRGADGEFPDDYASGGAGVWISRKALQILVAAPPTDDTVDDRWLGDTLRKNGIICHRDQRYCLAREWKKYAANLISCETTRHDLGREADMDEVHRVCWGNK